MSSQQTVPAMQTFERPGRPAFRVYAASEKGAREENQDNYLVMGGTGESAASLLLQGGQPVSMPLYGWPEECVRLAVADGMGGQSRGREISRAAVEHLTLQPPCSSVEEMRDMLYRLHAALSRVFYTGQKDSPGTTLVIVDFFPGQGTGILASIGDSRAYLVHDTGAGQLTRDNRFEEYDWRSLELSREDYEYSLCRPARAVAQSLGNGSFGVVAGEDGSRPPRHDRAIRLDLVEDLPESRREHADVRLITFSPDRDLLLATDGLWEGGSWNGPLTDDFVSAEELQAQVDAVGGSGAGDNITLVVCGYR